MPLVLQTRDKGILLAVYRCRFLTREQIQDLFFKTTSRANRRLNKLFLNGYLNRVYLPTVIGSCQAIYSLAEHGAKEVALSLGIDLSRIRYSKNGKPVKPLFLEHTLAINDFRLALEKSANLNPDRHVISWLTESNCSDTFTAWDEKSGSRKELVLRPDAYGQYRFEEKMFSFFLEMDMGTMSNKRLLEKINRYLAYKESGAYQERYKLNFFRVLVVTSGDKRLANLKALAGNAKASNFWFTTYPKIKQDILGFIWQRLGTSELFSLVKEESR